MNYIQFDSYLIVVKMKAETKPILKVLARRWLITYHHDFTTQEKCESYFKQLDEVWKDNGNIDESDMKPLRYFVACIETCPTTKRIHSHIYVELLKPMMGETCLKLFKVEGAHLDKCKGNQKQNIEYVKKVNQPNGCPPNVTWMQRGSSAKSNNFAMLIDSAKDGASVEQITEEYPEEVIRNRGNVIETIEMFQDRIRLERLKAQIMKLKPREFQQALLDECDKPTDDRRIIWYADPLGKMGKTTLIKMLLCKYGERVLVITGGQMKDIAQAWRNQDIIVFSYVRSMEDKINYHALESCKDGLAFNVKYRSRFTLHDTPHVIVMANFGPEEETLTKDRWDIRWLSEPVTVQPQFLQAFSPQCMPTLFEESKDSQR